MILDSSIHQINHYPADTTIRETNGVIRWIEIYPVEAKARYSLLFITFWTVGWDGFYNSETAFARFSPEKVRNTNVVQLIHC